MKRYKILIDTVIEVDNDCNTHKEVLKEFFNRGPKSLNETKRTVKLIIYQDFIFSLQNGKLIPLWKIRDMVILHLKEEDLIEETNNARKFIRASVDFSKPSYNRKILPTYGNFLQLLKEFGLYDVRYDVEFKKEADEYDRKILEKYSDKNKEKRSEEHEK